MIPDLCISLVTRERPALLLSVLQETRANMTGKTLLIVQIDRDDEATLEIHPQIKDWADVVDVRPRELSVGAKYNRALELDARWYLMMGDHAAATPRGFDEAFVRAGDLFPDYLGVVGNGWTPGGATYRYHQAISRELAALQGFIYPPYFPFWFVDTWLDEIAYGIDRYAYSGTTVHQYPKPNTMNRRDIDFWCGYYNSLWPERRSIIERVLDNEAFQEPHWRRKLLRAQLPLMQDRSQRISNFARSAVHADIMRGAIQAPDSEHYQKAKTAAIEHLKRISAPGV